MDPDVRSMNYSQCVSRLRTIHARLATLAAKHRMSRADEQEADQLSAEAVAIDDHRRSLDRADQLARGSGAGRIRTEGEGSGIQPYRSGGDDDYDRDGFREPDSIEDHRDRRYRNPWDLTEVRLFAEPGKVAAELRSRALSCIEKMPGASRNIRRAATDIIEEFDSKDSRLARQCIVTSKPAYFRAWTKLACNKPHSLTVDEQRAVADVENFRAMSLTDVQGGYLIPFQLDPTVIVTSTFVRSDLRQAARVVIATGDVWNGVSAQNVQWSFQAEGAEVTDNAPPFGQPSIPNFMARGFVPISIEAMADEQNVAQEVGRLLANGKLDLEGLKFIQGSGIGEPTGIITALSISGNSGSVTTTASAGVFALVV